MKAFAALVALALVSCSTPPEVLPTQSPLVLITSSPAPSRTASPSPARSPVPARTVAPTELRQPTTKTAGLQILPFYAEVRELYPLLPVTPQIDFDLPAGTDANALFTGLNPVGQPMFRVREDFVLDRGTAAHEIGHAFDAVLAIRLPTRTMHHDRYWTFRGFPGTWTQTAAEAIAQPTSSAQWILSPTESWAEAFRASVMLEPKERTLDYGKTIDPLACRAFFLEMMALAFTAH